MLKLLLLLTSLYNLAKSPHSDQVRMIEDMQMTKGPSAYKGAFGLKGQMRKKKI